MAELVLNDVDDAVLHDLRERATRHRRGSADEAKAHLGGSDARPTARRFGTGRRLPQLPGRRAGPSPIVRTFCVRTEIVEHHRGRCQRWREVVRAGSPCGRGPSSAKWPG